MTLPHEAARPLAGTPDPRDHVPGSAELADDVRPRGEGSTTLRVGSLAIELSGLDTPLLELVERNYHGFVVGSGQEPTFNVRYRPVGVSVRRSPRGSYLHLPRGEGRREEARVASRSTEEGLELWSYFFAGSLDLDATAGRLLLCDANESDLSQAVENYLRFFVATAALRMGGFLLHSAGVVRHDRAFLFFGPSGAGKSTTAGNVPPDTELLGDDLVLVEHWRETFRACGVPFRGTFQGPVRGGVHAPVAMACRLFQASEARLDEAPRTVQVAELLGELPFLLDDRRLQDRATDTVLRFVEAVPVRRLYLRPDASYWSILPSS
jgi:hypothetical protein